LAEEVARFYGYDVIPATMMKGEAVQGGFNPRQKQERRIGSLMRGLGYSEILTYTFTGQVAYDKIRLPKEDPLRKNLTILNPLGEDTSQMRILAVPAMLETLARNNNYRNESARLYELARVYLPNEESETLCDENLHLTLGAYGDGADFFVLKGVVEALLKELRIANVTWTAYGDDTAYHPGRCAELRVGDVCLGRVGQVHPLTAKNYDFDMEVFAAELDVEALLAVQGAEPLFTAVPKYPAVTRDLAVVCETAVTVADLLGAITSAGGKRLVGSQLFDIYTGEQVAEGKKSVAFALRFRADDKTLTDEDVDEVMEEILTALREKLGAEIR